jgi:hypothetical protein
MKAKTILEVAKEHKLLQQFLGEELFERYLANIKDYYQSPIYRYDQDLIDCAFRWSADDKVAWANIDSAWKKFCKNPTKLNLYLTRCSNEDYNV